MNSLFLMHTGGPGAPAADAWLTTVHIGDLGLCYLDGVELDELRYPLRVLRRGIEPDSEGAGRFRGAPAGFCEYGPVGTRMEAWFASDGTINAPQGCGAGGKRPVVQFRRGADGRLTALEPCGASSWRRRRRWSRAAAAEAAMATPGTRPRPGRHGPRRGLDRPRARRVGLWRHPGGRRQGRFGGNRGAARIARSG